MARTDALLKISKVLIQRRNELRRRLSRDLQDLGHSMNHPTGDVADAAFGNTGDEMTSQLAQFESREVAQIELALQRIKQDRYGVCDMCSKKIPLARLNALPYCVMCVTCQAEVEKDSSWMDVHADMAWGELRDSNYDDSERDYAAVQAELGK